MHARWCECIERHSLDTFRVWKIYYNQNIHSSIYPLPFSVFCVYFPFSILKLFQNFPFSTFVPVKLSVSVLCMCEERITKLQYEFLGIFASFALLGMAYHMQITIHLMNFSKIYAISSRSCTVPLSSYNNMPFASIRPKFICLISPFDH